MACSFNNNMQDDCHKEVLTMIAKCDLNNPEHEKLLVYLELSVKDNTLKVDTLIGNINSIGKKIIKTFIDCSNERDLENLDGCNMKFIYNRHGIKNHNSLNHNRKVLSFKKEHGLESIEVLTTNYYDY